MDIKEYFQKINSQSQQIFSKTLEDYSQDVAKTHHLSANLFEFSENLFDTNEKELLQTVALQIESATFSLTLGLYRQSFATLRLSLEMALAAAYFSINKLEHHEWLKGSADIKWSKLIDKESGVLSTRFVNAFFSGLSPYISDYNGRAVSVYRSLSEYVHGNNETWSLSGKELTIKTDLVENFFQYTVEISEIISFVLSCRYITFFTAHQLESVESCITNLSHLEPIRVLFGGPK